MLEKIVKDIRKLDNKNLSFLYYIFEKEMKDRGIK